MIALRFPSSIHPRRLVPVTGEQVSLQESLRPAILFAMIIDHARFAVPATQDLGLRLKRIQASAKFSEMTGKNTAKVIDDVRADVACIVEAENRPILHSFNNQALDLSLSEV